MSAADIEQQLPVPTTPMYPTDDYLTRAPQRPRQERMNVKAIPFNIEEKETVQEVFDTEPIEEVDASNNWLDPEDFLEAVFFNRHKNMIYKLYIDGSWESLRVAPELLLK